MSGTRTHLTRGQSGEVYVSPLLLNGFTVCTSDTGRIVEGVPNVTLWTVRRQVELWDEVREREF